MTRSRPHAAGRLLYLGGVSGLVGGLAWFLLDTLARGAAMGPAFFAEISVRSSSCSCRSSTAPWPDWRRGCSLRADG